jgi:hypothetical protein
MDAIRRILIALIAILFIGSICGCVDENKERMDDFIDVVGEPISDVESSTEECEEKGVIKDAEELSEGPQMEIVSKPVIIVEEFLSALNEYRYDDNEADGYASSSIRGHAVRFSNNEKLNLVEVRMCGARYDDGKGNFEVEIWDDSLKTMYSASYDYTDFFSENYMPLKNSDLKWVTIDIPEIQVNSDFYVVIFTYGDPFSWKNSAYKSPTDKGGIATGRDSDTKSGHSFMVMKDPNKIIDWETITTWDIRQEDTDWMIRAVDEIK